jgi:peroxiredoxin
LQVYQRHLPEIEALGASLLAVSPHLPDYSLSTAEQDALTFDVLSDVGNRVAREYRLTFPLSDVLRPLYSRIGVDLPRYNGDESWELPMPGTFVIDRDAAVRLAFVDADYTKRLEATAILESLRRL